MAENAKIDSDGYDGFGAWHLAEDTGPGTDTKEAYKFPFGEFRRAHKSTLIAAKQRAGAWNYADVLNAADKLLEDIPEPDQGRSGGF